MARRIAIKYETVEGPRIEDPYPLSITLDPGIFRTRSCLGRIPEVWFHDILFSLDSCGVQIGLRLPSPAKFGEGPTHQPRLSEGSQAINGET